MDHTQKKKREKSDVKSKKRKSYPKSDDVSSASTSYERKPKTPKHSKINVSEGKSELKRQCIEKKKPARSSAKRNNRKTCSKNNDVSRNCKTPKQMKACDTDTLPSSSSKTPSTSTPRSSFSTRSGDKTPCSFYKVTEDEDGKPVFSKSLLKYFFTVDSPEMEDLKKKRWNTSFLHETPKPNREIKIFTEDDENNPKYFENVPDIDSDLPDVPGSLHADIFSSMPANESDEELKNIFKEITPVKGPSGKRKRKSTRISCYNGKPLPDDTLLFDYSDLVKPDSICFDGIDSKENIVLFHSD